MSRQKLLLSKNRVAFTFAHYRFILRVRSLIFVARVHAKCIVRNLQNAPSDVSITIPQPRPAQRRAVNSYRKLIQDNYHDMKRWSILIAWRVSSYAPFVALHTILQRVAPTELPYRPSRYSHKCREYFVSVIAAINISMRPLLISLIGQKKIWELSTVSCI